METRALHSRTALSVLHIVEATSGGVARHVLDLVSGLRALGIIQGIAYSSARADQQFLSTVSRWADDGLAVVEVPMARGVSPARDLQSLRRVLDFQAEAGPFQLLHGHSSKGGALARMAAALNRGRAIYTPNAMAFTSMQLGLHRRALYWFFEFALRPATAGFVAVSEGEAADARRLRVASPERLFLVHNGINSPSESEFEVGRAERPHLRKLLDIESDRIAFLSAGRLSYQKAPDILVRAAQRVVSRRPSALFLWAGDGELRSDIQREIARRGLRGNIRLLGHRVDLPRLLPAFDALVMPSRYEGLPYALLEAMSAGLPVIGTRVSGIRDLVEDGSCGYVIQSLSPEQVADAVLRLIDEGPDRRAEMGAAARKLVFGRYTIERMVSNTAEVYESILRLGRRGAGSGTSRLQPSRKRVG